MSEKKCSCACDCNTNPNNIPMFIFGGIMLLLFIGLVFSSSQDVANREQLANCIIGEAVGEGYEGMKAVALVYRNRERAGLPMNCKALKRKDIKEFVSTEGGQAKRRVYALINDVYSDECDDITLGATHYENVERYGEPYWAKNMLVTTKIGNHTFYKKGN